MRSVTITVGPFTAVGTYEFDTSGICLYTAVLAIAGTCTAQVESEYAPGTWLEDTDLESTSSTASATSVYAHGKRRLNITAVSPGGSAAVYLCGMRG